MKKILIIGIIAIVLQSCGAGRGISIYEAANSKQKCGRNWIK